MNVVVSVDDDGTSNDNTPTGNDSAANPSVCLGDENILCQDIHIETDTTRIYCYANSIQPYIHTMIGNKGEENSRMDIRRIRI